MSGWAYLDSSKQGLTAVVLQSANRLTMVVSFIKLDMGEKEIRGAISSAIKQAVDEFLTCYQHPHSRALISFAVTRRYARRIVARQ